MAYAIARGDPEDEVGQLILVAARGEGPSLIASHAPGAFDEIQWIDEERMAVGYWDGQAPSWTSSPSMVRAARSARAGSSA
jgi:hypothetical protein